MDEGKYEGGVMAARIMGEGACNSDPAGSALAQEFNFPIRPEMS